MEAFRLVLKRLLFSAFVAIVIIVIFVVLAFLWLLAVELNIIRHGQ